MNTRQPGSRMQYPTRRTCNLLIGRISEPNATYFLTMCDASRQCRLTEPEIVSRVQAVLNGLHASGDFELTMATLMPDHVHLLGRLGPRLSLSRVVAKFKAETREILARSRLDWQANYFDHRLRDGTDIETFARYLFLNPYRARLITQSERWAFTWRWGEIRFLFEEEFLATGRVPEEWLNEAVPAGACDY